MSDIEYVMVMHNGSRATRFMSEDFCKDLMEQLAAAQSREVCTVAHSDEVMEFCPYCKIESLRERLAEAESRLNLADAEITMLRHFNAEAEALLRKARDAMVYAFGDKCDEFDDECDTCQAWLTIDRIDAHLAREKPATPARGCVIIGEGYCTTHKQDALMCIPAMRALDWKEVKP